MGRAALAFAAGFVLGLLAGRTPSPPPPASEQPLREAPRRAPPVVRWAGFV
jgi:hypothetical protein